jgi:hypothetical protein
MPRNTGTNVEQNFAKGLITEAHGLNFPEDACTATENCIFHQTGQVRRRLGIDLEAEPQAVAYDNFGGVISEFLWRAVASTGSYVFLVVQIGEQVSFFELSVGGNVSANVRSFAVDLNNYRAPGAGIIRFTPASFAAGNGRLFIAHPSCDPVVVEYDEVTDSISQERLQLKIRDFEGIDDGTAIDFQPVQLTRSHLYNLMNQGWYNEVRVGSGTRANSGPQGAGGPISLPPTVG